jgi:ribosomal-protein-alanine N-acetyltransferase
MNLQPGGRSLDPSRPRVAFAPPHDPSLTERALVASDLDAVMDIEVQAYPHPWSRGNFADSLAAGHRMRGLFDEAGALVAYGVSMAGVEEWHLLNLTVAPAAQARGHARRLLAGLLVHAREGGARRLWLEVRVGNARARRLYEGCGFAVIGLRRGYYPAGHGAREDAVVMSLAWG